MDNTTWIELLVFSKESPASIWGKVAVHLHKLALDSGNYALLHQATVFPDRLLSEAAYELWESFADAAPHTSQRLIGIPHSHAILILDALSLREMPIILKEAEKRGISVTSDVTFSEVPSDTKTFAQALGVASRATFEDDGKTSGFKLFAGEECYTDIKSIAFEDVRFDNVPNVFIWHSFLDDKIHNGLSGAELESECQKAFSSNSFWKLVDKLRQGRRLIITSDHGYGVAEQFSSELKDDAARMMKEHFKAQRFVKEDGPADKFFPPLFVQQGNLRIVTGQRSWKVPGRSKVIHGGLSLLEVASPWIEVASL